MKSPGPIGVIFDMDGVLVDSAAPHFESWKLLAAECGGTVTRDQFAATFGRQNRDIVPILFGEVSEARMRELSDRKEELYRDLVRKNPPILPGAGELIRGLHQAGVRLAVGSSGPRENIDLVLEAMWLANRISVVVSGASPTRRSSCCAPSAWAFRPVAASWWRTPRWESRLLGRRGPGRWRS